LLLSPLASINENNVKELGLAWYLDLPDQQTLEGTPLAVNGVLYFSGTYGKTFAVDARTGLKPTSERRIHTAFRSTP
jgi:quinohemoprotein ethanol dehydrogenase